MNRTDRIAFAALSLILRHPCSRRSRRRRSSG